MWIIARDYRDHYFWQHKSYSFAQMVEGEINGSSFESHRKGGKNIFKQKRKTGPSFSEDPVAVSERTWKAIYYEQYEWKGESNWIKQIDDIWGVYPSIWVGPSTVSSHDSNWGNALGDSSPSPPVPQNKCLPSCKLSSLINSATESATMKLILIILQQT